MPMYEYGCLSCNSRFDRLRRIDQDDAEISCPGCRSPQVERRLSVFAAHTRGNTATSETASVATASGGGCCGGSCGCGSRN